MKSIVYFGLSALFEIAGCFSFWVCLRQGRSQLWFVPGAAALVVFAFLLTRVEAAFAGRAYAAYGGIYVAASLLWLWAVEHATPDRFDLLGCCCAWAVLVSFSSDLISCVDKEEERFIKRNGG